MAESRDGDACQPGVGQLVDAVGDVWTIGTGVDAGRVKKNGANQTTGSAFPFTTLLYYNHHICGRNSAGEWRSEAAPWALIAGEPRPKIGRLLGAGNA